MAFGKSSSESKATINLTKVKAEISNVRKVTDTFVSFTLKCEGFSFYNMQMIEGKNGEIYVNPSSTKAKDGKWYPDYAVYLSKEDKDNIVKQILGELE